MSTPATKRFENETVSERIARHAQALVHRRLAVCQASPRDMRTLRSFTSGEIAKIVGVADDYLRQLSLDGPGPTPELGHAGRRSYTLRQINELRQTLTTVNLASIFHLKALASPKRITPRCG